MSARDRVGGLRSSKVAYAGFNGALYETSATKSLCFEHTHLGFELGESSPKSFVKCDMKLSAISRTPVGGPIDSRLSKH